MNQQLTNAPKGQGVAGAERSGNTPFPPYVFSKHIPMSDATCDATDDWNVMMDPENVRGDLVMALFRTSTEEDTTLIDLGHGRYREAPHECTVHRLIGFTVESRDFIRFVDREEVERIIGEGTVGDLEDAMDEEANW